MRQKILLKVGKKGAIYLPKRVLEALGLNEGGYVIVKIGKGRAILEVIPDPLLLAAFSKKWASTTVEDFERESMLEQERSHEDST
ncbi:MAG: AbrB/MazE/SpoVT family DNA-binding domain-containing protein [Candidatus Nezhaarchaeales archaeon]